MNLEDKMVMLLVTMVPLSKFETFVKFQVEMVMVHPGDVLDDHGKPYPVSADATPLPNLSNAHLDAFHSLKVGGAGYLRKDDDGEWRGNVGLGNTDAMLI